MSTVKSDNSDLTINASGSTSDIKFQANGVEKASISSAGAFTSTTIDATALTGLVTDDTVDESSLKSDNAPTNDYVLTAKSSAAGGLTWAAAGGGDLSFGGDTFGADKSVGSNDDYAFNLEQNGTDRLKLFHNGTRYQAVFTGYSSAGQSDNKTVVIYGTSGGGGCIRCQVDTTTNTGQMGFFNPNGQVGWIGTNGSATSFYTSSDYRLKENVVPMTGSIDRLKKLNPSKFNFIADPDSILDGFLAHEAQEVVPEATSGTKDEVDDNGDAVMQGIDQAKLVPLLVSALQEAIARIEVLENT